MDSIPNSLFYIFNQQPEVREMLEELVAMAEPHSNLDGFPGENE